MWNPFKKEKSLTQPVNQGGWIPLIRESFSGAWQRNIEVNQETALSYYAVFSCISLISSDISKMRPVFKKMDSYSIWNQSSSPSQKILDNPNSLQNRIQFFESWINSKLCHGNTYVLKIRNNKDEIIELRIIDPCKVTPLISASGQVFYQVNPDNISGIESSVIVPAREVIHDRFNCLHHPIIGLSPIYAGGLAATQGHLIQQSSAVFYKNGGKPSGIIEVPGSINEEKAREIKTNWDTSYGGENSGKTGILSGGAKYTPITMTSADAQTVEQLKMTGEVVCSVFKVPAYKVGIGDLPSYDNIEALEQQYYSQCLQNLIESIEILLNDAFDLGSNETFEFDIDALLRMDSERRVKTLGEAVKNTIMTPNEARKRENLPPIKGGDSLYLQQQNYSLEALAKRDASDDPFSKSNDEKAKSNSNNESLTDSDIESIKAVFRGYIKK